MSKQIIKTDELNLLINMLINLLVKHIIISNVACINR